MKDSGSYSKKITKIDEEPLSLEYTRKIMNEATDSIILFKSRDERWLDKEVIGVERMMTDNFL